MKTKKKLALNKQTISSLNASDMAILYAGTGESTNYDTACQGTVSCPPPTSRFCPTNGCMTTAYNGKTYCEIHYQEFFESEGC